MATKHGLRKAMFGAYSTKQREQLLDMYALENAPTPYLTKLAAKERRRRKLAYKSKRRNNI